MHNKIDTFVDEFKKDTEELVKSSKSIAENTLAMTQLTTATTAVITKSQPQVQPSHHESKSENDKLFDPNIKTMLDQLFSAAPTQLHNSMLSFAVGQPEQSIL